MCKDRGIVISARIYRNTSQLVRMFLKNNGYIVGYAKGIYKFKKLDFDGPFKIFFEYDVEVRGNVLHNDIVLVTSSKCINAINYGILDRLIFFKKIQNFLESFFVYGYKDIPVYNFLQLCIERFSELQKPQFLHYAYFVCNVLKLAGLLSDSTLNKLRVSKRMKSFIRYLLSFNFLKEVGVKIENSLSQEFECFIKNNFHQYYNYSRK